MSLILHIETSTKVCSVAISKNGELISIKESQDDSYAHGEQLTQFIEQAATKAGVSLSDLNAVSVTSGPGSYTGLRIGVSTAKGLCYALNIPLISVNSLVNLAFIAKEKHNGVNICTMIDARRMEVYGAIYDSEFNVLKPISADVLDELSYSNFEPFVAVGDGSLKMQEQWVQRNVEFDLNIFCSAAGHAKYAYKCLLEEKFEDLAYFEPFYLKDFVFNGGNKLSK